MTSDVPRRAVIYCRLSPTPRGEESKGGNLQQQESKSREKCEREGWDVVEVVVEKDTSASKGFRPGWARVVELIESGTVDTVVARHVDRMYRQMRELEDLIDLSERTGVTLAAALVESGGIDLTTSQGRTYARIGAAMARQEIEQKSERQRLGHERRADAGRPWWNSRPFGFERDGRHREPEASALRTAYSDLLSGRSLYSIAQGLNRDGLLSPRAGHARKVRGSEEMVTDSGRWRASNLRAVLTQPRNAAIHTYKGQPTGKPATWEPIVSAEVYEAAQRLLTEPGRRPDNNDGKRLGLLTNLAECGKVLTGSSAKRLDRPEGEVCGGKMIRAMSKARADGSKYALYRCRECQGVTIPVEYLDWLVMREMIDRAETWVQSIESSPDAGTQEELDALRAEELRLSGRGGELAEMFADGIIDRQALTSGVERAEARLAEVRGRLADLLTAGLRAEASAVAADIEYLWQLFDDMDTQGESEKLRAIFTSMADAIICLPRGKGQRHPKPEDVRIVWRESKPS